MSLRTLTAALTVAVIAVVGLTALPGGAVTKSVSGTVSDPSPGGVLDQTTNVIIPPDSQLGTANIPLTCSLQLAGISLLSASATVTATGLVPTRIRPGQSITVTSAQATVTLPESLANLIYAIGVRGIKVKLNNFELSLIGATKTSTANVVTNNVIDLPVVPVEQNKPIVVVAGKDKPFTIGPLAAPEAGLDHLALGQTNATITALDGNGQKILFGLAPDLTNVCPAPAPAQLLATVNVSGSPGTGTVTFPGTYPPRSVPPNSIIGTTGFTYDCSAPGIGAFTLAASVSSFGQFGPAGLVFAPGESFAFQNSSGAVIADAPTATKIFSALRQRPGGAGTVAIRTELTDLHTTALRLSPTSRNILAAPVAADTVKYTAGSGFQLNLPQTGTLLAPFYFTATTVGTADVFLGGATATLSPVAANGVASGSPLTMTCGAPSPLVPLFPAVVR